MHTPLTLAPWEAKAGGLKFAAQLGQFSHLTRSYLKLKIRTRCGNRGVQSPPHRKSGRKVGREGEEERKGEGEARCMRSTCSQCLCCSGRLSVKSLLRGQLRPLYSDLQGVSMGQWHSGASGCEAKRAAPSVPGHLCRRTMTGHSCSEEEYHTGAGPKK